MLRRFLCSGLVILLSLSAFGFAARPAAAAPTGAEGLDVVLLIDSSGSMATSDPNKLALTASRLLIDLLSPGDRVALVDFDTRVTVLAPMTPITGPADQEALRAKLAAVKADGSTDYAAALKEAGAQFGAPSGERRRVVVFLTDGKFESGSKVDTATYQAGLDAEVGRLAAASAAIYPIALGNQPETAVVRNMALDSGGLYWRVGSAADLAQAFTGVLTEAKGFHLAAKYDRTLGATATVDTVSVDQFTRSLTVIATGRQGQPVQVSLSTGGVPVTEGNGVVRRTVAGYELLTVTAPQAGAWQVGLTGSGDASLLVLYDKSVRLTMMAPVTSARHAATRPLLLQVQLAATGAKFTGTIVAHVLRPGTTIPEDVTLADDGKHSDGTKGDGLYGAVWNGVQSEGDYRILIEALQGQTPVASRSVLVYGEARPLITVDSPAIGNHFRGERLTLAAHIALAGLPLPAAETAGLGLTAVVVGPDGTPRTIRLADGGAADQGDLLAGDGIFAGVWVPEVEGDHTIRFIAEGTLRGRAYLDEVTLPVIPVGKPVFVKLATSGGLPRIAPGGNGSLAVQLTSESTQAEMIELSLIKGDGLSATPVTVTVPAGGQAVATLEITAAANAAKAAVPVVIAAKGREGVAFTPDTLAIELRVGRTNILATLGFGLLALAGLAVLGTLAYSGLGKAFYRTAIERARVGGTLSWAGDTDGSADLAPLGLHQVSVGGAAANVKLPGCAAPVLFRIRPRLLSVGSPVRLGWASLRGGLSFGCEVTAEGDQRVSFRDFPKSLERLFHGDQFRCGDYLFTYENEALPPRPRRGA